MIITNTIGEKIYSLRKQKRMTQEQLAKAIGVSYQAVSKWENMISAPDISVLPTLAAVLETDIDSLLGYAAKKKTSEYYEERYRSSEYYWGVKPSSMCFEVLKLLPPDKPPRLLDAGCGEGKDAVFFAKNGYCVSAFDITESVVEKARGLADKHRVNIDFFRADICDYVPNKKFDVIFCSGVLNYIPMELRSRVVDNWKEHTSAGGLNAVNVFVKKLFIPTAPDKEKISKGWRSGGAFRIVRRLAL